MDKNFEELELRAYENDAEAQYELAVYYKNKQNNKSYVDWLKKSAKLNNSNAKVELAELYLQGVLIDKDEDLAISLLEEELEVNKNARLVLGKYYVNTRDEENIKKGLDLLLSIAGENAKATYEIGMSLCFLDDDAAKLWALNLDYNYKQNDNGELPDEFTKLDFNTIAKEDFKSKDMQYAGVRLLDKAWNMGEKRAAFALAMVSSDNRFVNPDKSIALQYLNELDDTFWIEKCFILNLWKDYSGILKILNNAEDGSIKDYLLARLYENYGFKKYDLSKSDKLYTKLFNNIQNSCDDDERIILSDLYCRGKGTEENIQKARETIDNCRVYYAHGRCSYDEVLNYDNIYNEKLDLDLRKYYNKFISIYNKTLEFDDDKYTYMFVQSKIPCILERSRLIYSTLYDELQNVYQDKTLDEKEIIKDIIGFYQSNLMFLSGVIEDFVADNWDVDIESDFCYKDFLKDIFEDTEYNNYINNVVEYIKSSYDYQQIELDKLVDEFNADCKNANVLKNTIKSKKTAEENLFSPITLGDVVMGAIAYGTMEDTKNEYNEYSSDVRTYIEAAEEEKADILEHVREKLADRCVDDYLEKLKGIISSDELKELYNKVLESKNEKISVIICRKIMDILKEAGIVSKLFDYDFSGEELFEKCKNASEPLRYLLLALETEPTNKKYYEYAISNYGDSNGNLYALAAMNGINIFSSIEKIIEDNISGSREDFEKILDNFSLDKNKYLEEYDEKHEQMLMDKIAAKKPEYSSDSVRQKILTEDYEKFLATLNTDTTEYLKKYLAVANSYSEINKIFDIKAEKIEFAKIIKYVCGNLLKIEVDVSLTEKQLKIAEGLILAYKNNKKITKDDFISLTLENDTMFNGKTADEIIKYELEQKDASSYIIAAKKLKEEQPVYSLLFIVKYFVFSDKYFNNNGDLCDVLTYLEKFEKDLYMAPVYDLYVAANRDWNELVSQKATDASINTIINEFKSLDDLGLIIDKLADSVHNYNDYEVIGKFISEAESKKVKLIKIAEDNKIINEAFNELSSAINNDFSILNRPAFIELLSERQYPENIQRSIRRLTDNKFYDNLFCKLDKYMANVKLSCNVESCFKYTSYVKNYRSLNETRQIVRGRYVPELEAAHKVFMPNDKDSDTEVLFFTMKDTLLSNEQGFALTNKGILYTDEQNEISMLDYNSIISFEVTRKFLSTKLMVVTSEGKIIELKNDFASDKMDDAVIYIKAMIKEIMASDIYIGESPVMVSNVTAPNNDMTKADNVTAESTDKVSDLRAGLNSNELPALLKQYFSTHAEPEKAMASSKLKAGLSLPSDCEVYYAQDATLLGSGKNGFAITSKGVYTRKMFEKNVIIKPLDVFKTGKQFSTDKSTPGLLLDGQFFVECLSGDKLVPLFNGLVEYLDKAKAENSAVSESDNSATKYCPNCGTALRGQAKFCSKCGYKL